MKIAILYICTGKYNQFFEDFYESSERYFINSAKKHYFVFTDDLNISNDSNVTVIEKKCEGFPLDSLMRFEMFLSIKEELKNYDYIYFFNSNMLFVDNITYDILPEKDGEIAFVLNAGYYNKTPFRYPYERNPRSEAFIPFRSKFNYKYVIGGVNGGKSKDYLKFCEVCHESIMKDHNKGIMAIYHDESHINKYYFENGGKALHPSYAYAEGYLLPFKPLIIIRDKTKKDLYFDKVINHSKLARVKKATKILYKAIIWPFRKFFFKS